ncbi:diphthine--ammonia ligase [Archaeoglobus sp.]
MKVLALISGGKDSMLALHEVAEEHEIVGLLGIIPENTDSYMFHSVNLQMLDVIADCLEIPITKLKVSGIEEVEVEEVAEQIRDIEADALCIGGIESSYQKKRFEKVCKMAGMELIAPLWERDVEEIMEKVVKNFETIIVSVSAMGLDKSFLGRRIDEKCFNGLKELNKKYKIHLAGEGGEYETLVLDAPLYKKRIKILSAKKVWDGMRGYYLIEGFSKISKDLDRKI